MIFFFFFESERERVWGEGVLLKHYPAHSVSKFANSFSFLIVDYISGLMKGIVKKGR